MLPRRAPKLMADINIVPYIDVMLVLLVIFMVTVPLIQQGIEIDLPKAQARTVDSGEAPDPLIITVSRAGQITLNKGDVANQPLTPDFLLRQLYVLLPDQQGIAYVRGDQGASYGAVVSAMVMLQTAGADSIGLITEPPEGVARR